MFGASTRIRMAAAVALAAAALLGAACGANDDGAPLPATGEAFGVPGTRDAPAAPPAAAPRTRTLVLRVEGMTCAHCEAAIRREVRHCAGVQDVTASHEQGEVVVRGAGMDEGGVRATIEKLGFTVKAGAPEVP